MTGSTDRGLEMDVESVRQVGRNLGDAPMRHLDELIGAVASIELSSGSYGAFGLLGTSLGDAFDEVKKAAHDYLEASRQQVSRMKSKAFDTANQSVQGDGAAARVAAGITDVGSAPKP